MKIWMSPGDQRIQAKAFNFVCRGRAFFYKCITEKMYLSFFVGENKMTTPKGKHFVFCVGSLSEITFPKKNLCVHIHDCISLQTL